MLNFYLSFESKKAKRWVPGVRAHSLTLKNWLDMTNDPFTKTLISEYRKGDANAKTKLPAVCWTGTMNEGKIRKAADMNPTGLYMVDIDHCPDVSAAWEQIQKTMRLIKETNGYDFKLMLAHITPSGRGLRLVFKCTEPYTTLTEHMKFIKDTLNLGELGDFDECVHDISRISFIPQFDDILFIDNNIFNAPFDDFNPIKNYEQQKVQNGSGQEADTLSSAEESKEEEISKPITWLGYPVQEIIDKMYSKALPCKEKSNRHENSLKLASDLLVLLDGDKEEVERVLRQQSWVKEIVSERNENVSQTIESALQRKTKREGETIYQGVSRKMNAAIKALYGKTYYELKKNIENEEEIDEQEKAELEETKERFCPASAMPAPPPVIRELISIAPEDFKVPAINALLPILGTLTSYVRTEDKNNAKELSTSFFSIIYAPPSSGKSFVERYINLLLRDLFLRDEVNDARDAIFARSQQKKSANDRSEENPRTSIRIMEAKNSEAEFLEKQRNNHGHHMFTYCSEIDQWRKGIRAAGGNKDDMVRIAWDNGKYGQNFRSSNTFKGKVQLFWNVLIAGTSDQLSAYFKNVTNGLVTRCSFAEIENQQFQSKIPQWGKLSAKDMKVVDEFIDRCDRMTYSEPLDYNPENCYIVKDEDFDKASGLHRRTARHRRLWRVPMRKTGNNNH